MQPIFSDDKPVLYLLPDNGNELTAETRVIQLLAEPNISESYLIFKRFFDVVFALIVMIFGFPVFLVLYLITKLSSAGPAFYSQERLGRFGKPFKIYKFRSMYVDAEKAGPQLSSTADPRITKWGHIIRKTRLDELPQFWNVLRGDMSVVGPRPERLHFAERITDRNYNYKKLSLIKPGITSLGQVMFGYAENIEEMCARMEYDLQYLRNINLMLDLQIMSMTVKVMLEKKGK